MSLIIGGMIAQILAVKTGGQEEWVLVFVATVVVAIAAAVILLIVQLASGTRRALGVTTRALLAGFVLLFGCLVFWTVRAGGTEGARKDLPIIAGLVLPAMVIILVQWLIVRWRTPRTEMQPRFGRSEIS